MKITMGSQRQRLIAATAMSVFFAEFAATDSLETATEPYKACAVPSFDWATYSTSTTARMYGMRGALSDGHIFAAGFVKSTVDSESNVVGGAAAQQGRFALKGPYSVADPTGKFASSVMVDLHSYSTLEGAKENAGGTWGQYEVGVVKIDAATGEPVDVFVFEGHGLDETTGIAASGGALAVSGHFTGNLTAKLADGMLQTIWNSNVEVGTAPDNADQFHPNTKDVSGHSGVDDGFVIKASASTGIADWIVRYPESNKDAQIVDVNIDDSNGNVFGAGYRCTQADDDGADAKKVCDGIVAMLSGTNGAVIWEKVLPGLGAAFRMKHDSEDGSLYVVGTTTFSGFPDGTDPKENPLCEHKTCSVVLRMSATDGEVQWERTLQGSPRWGVFGQNGGVGLASNADGPYIYVAIDDTGEETATSLDAGTPYAGCKGADGVVKPEYELQINKVVTAADCPSGSTFVTRSDADAVPPSAANTQVVCGDAETGRACVIKYHKYTGLPIWAHDAPEVSGLVPSSDGTSVHIGGWYSSRGGIPSLGATKVPEYLREQGLDGKTGGIYNAKISAETGIGQYVISSGGGSKDRLNDMVGDSEGNIYNVGYHQNLVMRWGNNLKTTMVEDDGESDPNADNPTQAVETQICVSKMAAAKEEVPSCLTNCAGNTDDATIDGGSCFIDGKCYAAGASTNAFGKPCFLCDPSTSQREWTMGPTVGATECYIGGTCVGAGQEYYYQSRAWNSPRILSECQMCDPDQDATAWSVKTGYTVNATLIPPSECIAVADVVQENEGISLMDDVETGTTPITVLESPPVLVEQQINRDGSSNEVGEPEVQVKKDDLSGGFILITNHDIFRSIFWVGIVNMIAVTIF